MSEPYGSLSSATGLFVVTPDVWWSSRWRCKYLTIARTQSLAARRVRWASATSRAHGVRVPENRAAPVGKDDPAARLEVVALPGVEF